MIKINKVKRKAQLTDTRRHRDRGPPPPSSDTTKRAKKTCAQEDSRLIRLSFQAHHSKPHSGALTAADNNNNNSSASTGANNADRNRSSHDCEGRPILHHKSTKEIKPRLKDGMRVYSAWWPDEDRSSVPSWYPGTIKSHSLWTSPAGGSSGGRGGSKYGPMRLYDVEFDDGDELDGVGDEYVFTEEDYLLQTNGGGDRGKGGGGGGGRPGGWIGVTNVVDWESDDGWAYTVGWYNVALFDGGEESFSLLADALRAYDVSVIRAKGCASRDELNLPEEVCSAKLAPPKEAIEGERGGGAIDAGDVEISGRRGKSIIKNDRDDADQDESCDVSNNTTTPPTPEVLRWIREGMSKKQKRRSVARGLRVKVRFDGNSWYGGTVVDVLDEGRRIKIEFDDGTEELSRFPDGDVVVDDTDNGEHSPEGMEASYAFVPSLRSKDTEASGKHGSGGGNGRGADEDCGIQSKENCAKRKKSDACTRQNHSGQEKNKKRKLSPSCLSSVAVPSSHMSKKRAKMFPRIDANWNRNYQNLVRYNEENGNMIIGPSTEGWPRLHGWIKMQRKEYKRHQAGDPKAMMYDSWIKKMDALGFDWAPMKGEGFSRMMSQRQISASNDEAWMKKYKTLKKFREEHGHCYVPRPRRNNTNTPLSSWIKDQRKHKKKKDDGKATPLTDERIRLLDEIGFDWNPSVSGGMRDKDWEAKFVKLVAYKGRQGNSNPKRSVPVLGDWAYRMREMYARNLKGETTTLTDAKIAKLESIGFKLENTDASL